MNETPADNRLSTLHQECMDSLVMMAAPLADRARGIITDAMTSKNTTALYREGHSWSGLIGRKLLQLAEAIDQQSEEAVAS